MRTIVFAAVLFSFVACKNNEKIEPGPVPQITKPEAIMPKKSCYEFSKSKDTIRLTLAMNGNNANGELAYEFFAKDKNIGTFSGIFIGDTLFADYSFQSEGVTSVREIVFLKQNDVLIQGSGEMTEKDNKQVFKDAKKLKFDNSIVLTSMDCE